MSIEMLPLTNIGTAAAAVVEKLGEKIVPRPGVSRIPCPDDTTWRALRSKDITASTAAGLLGAHEYATAYSLFQEKTGALKINVEDSGPVRRGRLLEPVAVQVLREEHPDWIIRHNSGEGRAYYRDALARLGATPDIEARDPARGLGVVQIKSVEASIFRKKWRNEDGEIEPPLWISVQAIIEATLTGAEWAAIAPIVVGHGVECPLIDIPLHAGIMVRIRKEVADFWRRVAENDPPPPDFARDGEVIAELYAADSGATIDLTGWNRGPDLASEDETLAEEIEDRTSRRKAIKAELLEKLGDAAIATINGRIFATAKTIRRKAYSVEASSYRDIRFKKGA